MSEKQLSPRAQYLQNKLDRENMIAEAAEMFFLALIICSVLYFGALFYAYINGAKNNINSAENYINSLEN